MSFINFSDIRVLLIGALITAIVLTIGCIKKKSIFSSCMLAIFTILLIIHSIARNYIISMYVDLIGIAICIAFYLVIDEIEIRRKKITQVFEDKYKK